MDGRPSRQPVYRSEEEYGIMFAKLLEKDPRILEWSIAGIGVLWIFLILTVLSVVTG